MFASLSKFIQENVPVVHYTGTDYSNYLCIRPGAKFMEREDFLSPTLEQNILLRNIVYLSDLVASHAVLTDPERKDIVSGFNSLLAIREPIEKAYDTQDIDQLNSVHREFLACSAPLFLLLESKVPQKIKDKLSSS